MIHFLKKNRKGNLADIMGTSICLLSLCLVFMSFVHFCSLLEYKRKLNDIARDYLLKLETTGTLTDVEFASLNADVENLRPSANGTYTYVCTFNNSNTPAMYGENVDVLITVTANYEALGLAPLFGIMREDGQYDFSAHYHSTSKS